jgi:hypothetical protein
MHHNVTRAPGEAYEPHVPPTGTSNTLTGSAHPRSLAIAVALIATGILAPATCALARPAHDIGVSTYERAATADARDHLLAAPAAITFTNPLGRSRGRGAGAGLL